MAPLSARTRSFRPIATRSRATRRAALEPWDTAYYAEKQRQAKYDFNEEELRPYFPLDRVLDGLFATAQALYEIEIVERDAATWDARSSRMPSRTPDGTMIAAFYVDLFPRENKRGGAWMNSLISAPIGRTAIAAPRPLLREREPAGGRQARPADASRSRDALSRVRASASPLLQQGEVRSLAGTNVAWDFVELPSQIMENWCWERSGLDLFAAHHETGETIPGRALREDGARAHIPRCQRADAAARFRSVDLALHQHYDPERDGDVMAYAREIYNGIRRPLPDDYAMLAGFGHVFAHPVGYAAGYYSYKWAEVLDADAFTRFKRKASRIPKSDARSATRSSPRATAKTPRKLYRRLHGPEPQLEPLLERTGLA